MIEDKKNAKKAVKHIRKIVKIRNSTKNKLKKREIKNNVIVKKCNKKVGVSKKDLEIISKINEYNTNGKKTIVYFIDSYYPIIDGVVAVLDNYARFMSRYFNVVVCTPKHKKVTCKKDDYFVLGANSMYLKKQGYDFGLPQFDASFTQFISMLKIDLVHIHAPFSLGNFGMDIAKKRHIPSLITFHSQFKQDFYKSTKSEFLSNIMASYIIKLYDKPTVALTMNDFSFKIMKEYGLKRDNVKILPNATDLLYKEFDENFEKQILNKYEIKAGKFTILFIGRFVKVKNIYLILDVLKQLYKINQQFQFVFMGYGPEEDKMKKVVKENSLENNVVFTGKVLDVDEKAVIIKNSNLLFFPSIYDTDGIVKIECACYSVPTLCLENTGVSSGLKNNETGFIEKNNLSNLVSRLDYLIKNVDFVKKTGKNAKEQIYITWEDVGERLKKIYDKLFKIKVLKNIKNKGLK